MNKVTKYLTSILIILLNVNLNYANNDYLIYKTTSQSTITFDRLIEELSHQDIVLFGEEHNDSIAHIMQLEVYKSLHEKSGKCVILSMEMFERDVQPIMNEYLAGWISEKNFIKESRAWSNYKDYAPLVNYAKSNHLKVVCANVPARYTNMVTRGGLASLNQLPKKTLMAYLPPLPIDTLQGAYYNKFLEVMGGHINPNMHIYQSQNLWDHGMADAIANAWKNNRKSMVLHLNGRFHSDNKLGIFAQLKHYLPNSARKVTITAIPASEYTYEFNNVADYVILTKS